jgi:hypothetical protein
MRLGLRRFFMGVQEGVYKEFRKLQQQQSFQKNQNELSRWCIIAINNIVEVIMIPFLHNV